jgi:error-prone DNA polymerase
MYPELHAASAFSFLEGASLPEALVDRAAELGYQALALLDRDGVYGAPRFHKAAAAAGIRPIIGCELTMGAGGAGGAGRAELPTAHCPLPTVLVPGPQPLAPSQWRLPVLVESRQGYRNLCRLVTRMKLRAPKGEGTLALEDLDGCTAGLVALVGREALSAGRHGVGGLVDRLTGLFGRSNVYVEIQRHLVREEEADNRMLLDLAAAFHVPVVATNGVRFSSPDQRPLYDVLTCIHHKTDLERAGRRLAFNAERYLKPPGEMEALFADQPVALASAAGLAERLQYTMEDLGYRFPSYPVPPGETLNSFLRKITEVGARERYRPYHDRARAQIARELDLIEKLDLAGYFLIVWDIVNFCRQHRILAQGRGSAANSAVCYSLGITAVDPVGMDLLFERFLSEERGEWPDIDLDLPSGDRRERVIQHVYEKYGRHGAAMTANVITYRGRSAAREVGKALGIEPVQIDRLAKVMERFEFKDPAETLAAHLGEIGLDCSHPRVRLFADLWQRIQDLPRHLGQHSGGMVICEGELDGVVPLENASMPGRVVVQWDKDDCADMGIVKIDLLGLGMMAVLQDALEVINVHRGRDTEPLGLWNMPPDDQDVYRLLQQADTMGVFQVESRAQMATLPRLKPERFYDIVVEVAIIRPGPIVGQMVHPYMNRRAGREKVAYPHPSLEPILARTLGVPLFQEQLLRIAMVAANFTGGQAEELRRAFGFKRSERRMKQIEVQLREGMARKGITGEAADGIVKSITSFALYGFPESHAASFALLVYASAYLKVHFPSAFYAALLSNQPMGFYHPATLVKDAQRRGVRFAPIDVQRSGWPCTVEEDGTIRLGLCYVAGLREGVGRAIEGSRFQGSGFREEPRAEGQGSGSELATGHRPLIGHQSVSPELTTGHRPLITEAIQCPKCSCDDRSMIEVAEEGGLVAFFCNVCASEWTRPAEPPRRFRSIEELIAKAGVNRMELSTLAEIGALNSFGYHRREALWQIERAVRPAGELFREVPSSGQWSVASEQDDKDGGRWAATGHRPRIADHRPLATDPASSSELRAPSSLLVTHHSLLTDPASGTGCQPPAASCQLSPAPSPQSQAPCPLSPMTPVERLVADYEGTGLTLGPHPMVMRRQEMALRGVLRASDLPRQRHNRRVRVAGAVITRQRPGTAKGFVFLTLEDETGIANVIVRPDLFAEEKLAIVEEPFLLVEGVLQNQEGVTSVRAERLEGLGPHPVAVDSHDFY